MVRIPTTRTVVIGAIAGAVAGLLLVVFIVVFRGVHEGWDDSDPVLALVLNGVVLVPGTTALGVAGVVLAHRIVRTGRWRAFGLIAGLVLAIPVGVPIVGSALWDPPTAITFGVFDLLSCVGIGLLAGRLVASAPATA